MHVAMQGWVLTLDPSVVNCLLYEPKLLSSRKTPLLIPALVDATIPSLEDLNINTSKWRGFD